MSPEPKYSTPLNVAHKPAASGDNKNVSKKSSIMKTPSVIADKRHSVQIDNTKIEPSADGVSKLKI